MPFGIETTNNFDFISLATLNKEATWIKASATRTPNMERRLYDLNGVMWLNAQPSKQGQT